MDPNKTIMMIYIRKSILNHEKMILELYFDKGDFKILPRTIFRILPYNYHEIFFSIIIIFFFKK